MGAAAPSGAAWAARRPKPCETDPWCLRRCYVDGKCYASKRWRGITTRVQPVAQLAECPAEKWIEWEKKQWSTR